MIRKFRYADAAYYRSQNRINFTPTLPADVPTPAKEGMFYVFKDSSNSDILSKMNHDRTVEVLLDHTDVSQDDVGSVASVKIYVDKNRIDSYNENGTAEFPFTTISAAIAYITAAELTGATINLAFGSYTEAAAVTFPNVPLVIYGNGSTLTASAGVTVTNSNFTSYDLNTIGNVSFSATSAGRVLVQGGSITGNIAVAGLADFKSATLAGGVITVASTGQFLAIVCTFTSTLTSAGTAFIRECNINTGKATALIASTDGALFAADNVIVQSGNGGCISCDNGANGTSVNNAIVNNYIVNSGSGVPVACGTAATIYSKNNIISGVANTGTGFKAVNSEMIGTGTVMALGSDATGDIYYRAATTGLLTALHAPTEAGTYNLTCDGTTQALSWVSTGA